MEKKVKEIVQISYIRVTTTTTTYISECLLELMFPIWFNVRLGINFRKKNGIKYSRCPLLSVVINIYMSHFPYGFGELILSFIGTNMIRNIINYDM